MDSDKTGKTTTEIHNTGFNEGNRYYGCMSDVETIVRLISFRAKLDRAHGALDDILARMGVESPTMKSGLVFLLYVNLDWLIEQCNLTVLEEKIVKMVMDGCSIKYYAYMSDYPKQTIQAHFRSAAAKIASQNRKNWKEFHRKKPALHVFEPHWAIANTTMEG